MGAGAAAAELPLERCCIDACCAQNDGASVPEVCLTHEASEALSSSFALRHRAWMQANAVSQRAAWLLLQARVTTAAACPNLLPPAAFLASHHPWSHARHGCGCCVHQGDEAIDPSGYLVLMELGFTSVHDT